MSDLHVVFGSSGGIGNAVVRQLADRGRQVRGVNRSGEAIVPNGVELIAADAEKLEDVRRAMDGATVVYNCLFPTVQEAIIEVAADTGAKIVLASTLYMYDPKQGPMSETSRHSFGNREGGEFYARVAEELLEAHSVGRVRATVGGHRTSTAPMPVTASVVIRCSSRLGPANLPTSWAILIFCTRIRSTMTALEH